MRRDTMLTVLNNMGMARENAILGPDLCDTFSYGWSNGERMFVACEHDANFENSEEFRVISITPKGEHVHHLTTTHFDAVIDMAMDVKSAGDKRLAAIVEYCGLLQASQDARESLALRALDVACAHIQEAVGQTGGGNVSMAFPGDAGHQILAHFEQYIQVELAHLD